MLHNTEEYPKGDEQSIEKQDTRPPQFDEDLLSTDIKQNPLAHRTQPVTPAKEQHIEFNRNLVNIDSIEEQHPYEEISPKPKNLRNINLNKVIGDEDRHFRSQDDITGQSRRKK